MTRRIVVGTHEIANHVAELADGFRQLGHEVTSVAFHRNKFYGASRYDIEGEEARTPTTIDRLVRDHDTFVFVWESLAPQQADLPMLRRLGKRIGVVFVGTDVRHWSSHAQDYGVDMRPHVDWMAGDPLARPLGTMRRGEYWADAVFSRPNQSSLAVRPYHHFHLPLLLQGRASRVPGRDVPVIVHAPSHKGGKGTGPILQALEALRRDGVAFELRLLEGVSNREVIAALEDADVAIDQLYIPGISRFGQEALAAGCALASVIASPYAESPGVPPIWHLDPQRLLEPLRLLLTDRQKRVALGTLARPYVEHVYDHVAVAHRMLARIDASASAPADVFPTHYTTTYRPPAPGAVPDELRRMTTQLLQRWGLPADADPSALVRRGLIADEPAGALDAIPRWPAGTGLPRPAHAPWPQKAPAASPAPLTALAS